jgi:uncharacterized membrane protein YkoI
MKILLYQMVLTAAAVLSAGATGAAAQTSCAPNWTANHYKSFSDIQNEVKKQFGDVRILRVALCVEGGTAYFQIVIISGQGEVRRVKIAASNAASG